MKTEILLMSNLLFNSANFKRVNNKAEVPDHRMFERKRLGLDFMTLDSYIMDALL